MQNNFQSPESVILGVDTHLDIHVGAVISQAGKLLGTRIIQTNQIGYQELFDWAKSFGVLERAGTFKRFLTINERTVPISLKPSVESEPVVINILIMSNIRQCLIPSYWQGALKCNCHVVSPTCS
nr:hypothetical protein [Citrobacter freundii]